MRKEWLGVSTEELETELKRLDAIVKYLRAELHKYSDQRRRANTRVGNRKREQRENKEQPNYMHTIAWQMFGKRAKDLSPEEKAIYCNRLRKEKKK